ncbi:MAG: GNAT family N-acetyltransferase [Gammaproteobacteria bacterium]|nr:GNAT family N-acetyltransferase [Gammaproteobacteria bacterium]
MNLTVVDSVPAFEGLRDRWDALVDTAEHASIFTTWSWQWHWWRHYGNDQALRILQVEEAGQLLGILPLYIETVKPFPGVSVRVLRFVGTGGDTSPDYLDALIRRGDEDRVASILAQYLVRELNGWDVASITDLHADSAFRRALAAALAAAAIECRASMSARISYIDLPATWDDYLAAQSRDRRYTVRNTRRKFESLPDARFFVWQEQSVDKAVDRLIELHHLRWQQKGEAHAFSSPAYVSFHRELMQALQDKNQLRLYCMETGGAVIAMYYCYRFRDTVYYFQGGFDPSHERARPGLCLMGYAIEHAIQEGNHTFDMLRGEYDYKRQWAKATRETHQIVAFRRNPRAIAHRLRYSYLPGLKAEIKRIFGPKGKASETPRAASSVEA